ncbi:MAG: hypothetical protein JST02_10030 [Bacteroidetes bacterium]|nr:hypothetical protein [Bacteroidota bacterium]
MPTIKIKYSPSVNILRDTDFDFNYIVTPNTKGIFSHIVNDLNTGIKAHTIIGAYGIGKSSFLLAMQQTLTRKHIHFKEYEKQLKQLPTYEFVNIVGEYSSLISALAEEFGVSGKNYTSKDVIKAIQNKYTTLGKKGKGLAITIDESGKFLEYASNHKPEAELYFIQQLAELVNKADCDMMLTTTLHQDFNAYAAGLNKSQQQEWDKVRGRLKDIVFNEPVEQLLFLASERLSQKSSKERIDSSFDKLFKCIQSSKAFPLREYLEASFAKKLLPFDILSAAVLTLALQKYGQNERSLFSFIESNDYLGLQDKIDGPYYSLPQVYNYLLNNFYSSISTPKNNPPWSAIREALEKAEGNIKPEFIPDAIAILKSIGLLNMFASASGKLDLSFYINYGKLALGIKQPEKVIAELEKFKLVKYTKHNFRYSLQTGTDIDIDLAIDEAGRMVEMVSNVVHHLNQHFDLPFIAAKSVSYKTGTPRFFQFKLSEEPINEIPEGEIDGFVNLIFSDDKKIKQQIQEHSKQCNEAILFGYYKNTNEIKRLLNEIQKIKAAIIAHKNDKAAVKEFIAVEEHYKRLLNHYVLGGIYSNNENVIWYYQGIQVNITDEKSFNQTLSHICEQVYSAAPVFRNELMNKTKISGQISKARNTLLQKLLVQTSEYNIGFLDSEFPPEKSIYLALIKNTGIHHNQEGFWQLDKPTNKSFHELWKAGERFLHSSKGKERNLQEFIDILSSKPFKLKQGFIDYWVPIFMLIKNDEFALYENDIFIQELTGDIFELLNKKPGLFSIKAFDVSGLKLQLFNRYRILLNQAESNQPNSKTFIQTVKPFISFYRQLPEYAKQTNRLHKHTIALRQIITKAKDPEKTFFEDFPTAFGYSMNELSKSSKLADKFIEQLQASIRELRTAYDGLIDRFESYFIKDIIGTNTEFPTYRGIIKKRFEGLKSHLLLANQKPFYARLQSELNDRKAWLASIAQACINKPLNNITDEDELVLFDRLRDLVYEFDNLCEISESNVDDEQEEVLKLEITTLVKGLNKSLLRISKGKNKEVEQKQQEIKSLLGKDKKINIAILTKLLQEFLSND